MSSAGKGGSGRGEDTLGKVIGELSQETKPVRDILGEQFQEALNTGGIGARIPIIGAAQEQSRQATSNALRGVQEQEARTGLSRTPFGNMALAQTRLSGEQATSMIPSDIAKAFIGAAPQFAMAPVGAMVSGASALANVGAQRDIAKGNQNVQMLSSLFSAAASGAAACWIARALYGDTEPFYLARYWIFFAWRGRLADLVRWLYRRHGPAIARSRGVWLLRPVFAAAVARGRRALA